MIRTFPLVPGTPNDPSFDMGLGMTPITPTATGDAPPSSGACSCANIAALWAESRDVTLEISQDLMVPVVIVATGTICPGTEFTFDLDWTGDTMPSVDQIEGAYAWTVSPTQAGTLTVTLHADCAGATFDVPPLTLLVDATVGCVSSLGFFDPPETEGGPLNPRDDSVDIAVGTSNPLANLFKCYVANDPIGAECCGGSIVSEVVHEGDDYQTDVGNAITCVDATDSIEGIGCAAVIRVDDLWFESPGMSATATLTIRYLDAGSVEVSSRTFVITLHS